MATTPTIGSTTPALSSPGIGSGLDVAGIVAKLMAVEKQPLTLMDNEISADQARISAFGTLKSALATFQGTLSSLASASGFNTLAASVSDASLLTASVDSSAVPGTYSVEVTALAQAHKLASSGFASATDTVGSGTLTFDFGTFDGTTFTSNGSGAKTVTIAPGQNTLSGIRDAINAANIGVTATIVNDGSAAGNRLVITSNQTGGSNSVKITATDDDGNSTDASGLSQLAYDPAAAAGSGKNLTQKVAAQDATLVIDGITVNKPTNTVTDAIQGVTLKLAKTNTGSPAALTVAANTGSVVTLVGNLVNAYNQVVSTLTNLTKYDATQKKASVLTGDSTVRLIQTQLRSILGSALPGGSLTTLSQAGVSFGSDGTLSLDPAKLTAALNANPSGVTQLFAAVGTATDGLASVAGFGDKTVPGTYAVNVTQLATKGTLVGSAAAGLTITAGVNDSLTVNVDGVSATVTLAAGTYASADALAAEVRGKINGASAVSAAGSSVSVSQSGGVLTITSNRYGSASVVGASGNAAASLLGGSPTASAGLDIAGTINGVAAAGSGQTLVGAAGSPVDGLRVTIAGGPLGDRGTVTYGQGFAYRLNQLLTSVLDDTSGSIATRTDGLQKSIDDIQKREDAFNQRMTQVEQNYTNQFNALDTLLAQLNTQSTYLQQQLAMLPSPAGISSTSK